MNYTSIKKYNADDYSTGVKFVYFLGFDQGDSHCLENELLWYLSSSNILVVALESIINTYSF